MKLRLLWGPLGLLALAVVVARLAFYGFDGSGGLLHWTSADRLTRLEAQVADLLVAQNLMMKAMGSLHREFRGARNGRMVPQEQHAGRMIPANCFTPDDAAFANAPHSHACSLVALEDAKLPKQMRASSALRNLYAAQRHMAKHRVAHGGGMLHHDEPLVAHMQGFLDEQAVAQLRAHVLRTVRKDRQSGFMESPKAYVGDDPEQGHVPPALQRVFKEMEGMFDWPPEAIEIGYKYYPDVKHSMHRLHIDSGQGQPADRRFCDKLFGHVVTSLLLYLDSPDGGEVFFPYLDKVITPRAGDALMFHSFAIDAADGTVRHWNGAAHMGCGLKSGTKSMVILNFQVGPDDFTCLPGTATLPNLPCIAEGKVEQSGQQQGGQQQQQQQQQQARKEEGGEGAGVREELAADTAKISVPLAKIPCAARGGPVVGACPVVMPRLALGMGFVGDPVAAVKTFLAAGGRHIDGAFEYGNHKEIGEAVRGSGVPRAELFLTTKIPSWMLGAELTAAAIKTAREEMGVDYIDLVLLHTPGGEQGNTQACVKQGWSACRRDAWAAIQAAIAAGYVRLGGVSNFGAKLVDELHPQPSVNQLEVHAWSPNRPLLAAMRARGVTVMGYATTKLLFEKTPASAKKMAAIAAPYKRSPSAVLQAWVLAQGAGVVTTANSRAHIVENLELGLLHLSQATLAEISSFPERVDFHEHAAYDDRKWDERPTGGVVSSLWSVLGRL